MAVEAVVVPPSHWAVAAAVPSSLGPADLGSAAVAPRTEVQFKSVTTGGTRKGPFGCNE